MKVLSIFGTRPEAIKLAPVIKAMAARPQDFTSGVCVSGQHRELLDPVLRLFDLRPDHDLAVMKPDQSLFYSTARILTDLEPVLVKERPDWVLVQGDTTTSFVASLAAFYLRIPVAHVEAGLRSRDLAQPFPEEANRRLADALATLHFAPTEGARQNLLAEGVPDSRIRVTGNTVIDALLDVAARPYDYARGPLASLPLDSRRVILVTAHRRESFGGPLRALCHAIRALAERYPDAHIVYPVHLNPNVQQPVRELLAGRSNISLHEPLDYEPFVHLMKRATLILTDSGGLQEEAPSLGVPVLVMREVTERPEGVAAGAARVVGTDTAAIVAAAAELLDSAAARARMSQVRNPYGDGKASARILEALLEFQR
ncbi:MAG TPA: UDP-N-acetylglucosamine 2-epimerase (non-hydrolyzing) [Candidatus Xenobia bacterium]|nr:UDP-N-acetylglucosamine 2-epimerase (non-hydrolyzing) [Candidatus Xenobia bacterium]